MLRDGRLGKVRSEATTRPLDHLQSKGALKGRKTRGPARFSFGPSGLKLYTTRPRGLRFACPWLPSLLRTFGASFRLLGQGVATTTRRHDDYDKGLATHGFRASVFLHRSAALRC